MRAYVSIPEPTGASWDGLNNETYLARTVHEAEPRCVKTGLLDARGVPLYRFEKMDPIGFTRLKER